MLRGLGGLYIVGMILSFACLLWCRTVDGCKSFRLCVVTFLVAFFAGPSTAVVHVWLSQDVRRKMFWTQRLTLGLDAYFEAYRYLLKGNHPE